MKRLFFLFILGLPLPLLAGSIPKAYIVASTQYGIPASILYAVAKTESGRETPAGVKPWPWTLNIGGKPFYYDTREEAHESLNAAIAEGRDDIAVGLMQVYWRFHHRRFPGTWEALDPYRNLDVGASIYKEALNNSNHWDAIGRYNTGKPDTEAARAYRKLVFSNLIRVID